MHNAFLLRAENLIPLLPSVEHIRNTITGVHFKAASLVFSSPHLLSTLWRENLQTGLPTPLVPGYNRVNSGWEESFKVLVLMYYSTLMDCTLLSQPLLPCSSSSQGIWLKGVFCITKVIKDPGLCQASLILLSLLFPQTLVDVAF